MDHPTHILLQVILRPTWQTPIPTEGLDLQQQHAGVVAGHVVADQDGGAGPVEEDGPVGGAGPVVLGPAYAGASVVAPKRSAYLGRIEDPVLEYR
ncbi:hypothetical protein L1987_48403 [Smallanthus sonchifolius]|uniref:Uncharacterized protein n=1 Tax=Smallanthus sonchifolius TaxID=185202 RepID=A0ACB9FRJ0_9ASTR|nr:hypothetical protein L1987_48403 [Smallanthus sonchifolius]